MAQKYEPDKEKIRGVYDRLVVQGNSCCPEEQSDFSGFQPSYEDQPGNTPEADLGLGCGISLEKGGLGSGAGTNFFDSYAWGDRVVRSTS